MAVSSGVNETDLENLFTATEENMAALERFEKEKEHEYEEFKKSEQYHEMESEA